MGRGPHSDSQGGGRTRTYAKKTVSVGGHGRIMQELPLIDLLNE